MGPLHAMPICRGEQPAVYAVHSGTQTRCWPCSPAWAGRQHLLMCTPGTCTAAGCTTSMQDAASFTAGELVLSMSRCSSSCHMQRSRNAASIVQGNYT